MIVTGLIPVMLTDLTNYFENNSLDYIVNHYWRSFESHS